jgi:glycine/D-amino acid oxidase-like deaminating enzyme
LKTDYIIVGQGLAGSLLAWELIQLNQKVTVIDTGSPTAASRVAAGIFLPVTGRRIVKTWMADTLIPFSVKTFNNFESLFKQPLLHSLPVLEIPASIKEMNEWQMRAESHDLKTYIKTFHVPNAFNYVNCSHGAVELTNSGYVNLRLLLSLMRQYFCDLKILQQESFDFSELHSDQNIVYKDIIADKIIFCEGAQVINNPFFNSLPFQLSKGEIVSIYAEKLPEDYLINQGIFILPLGNHYFRVGSTYQWNDLTPSVTLSAKTMLTEKLKSFLKVPFDVVDQQAGIRPTVKERRPFLGMHAQHQRMGIFNGLGTKGVMLAPYFAHHFAQHLVNSVSLIPEVDIKKYI